jgi:hypothetical protein
VLVSDSETRGAEAHGRVRLDDGLEAEHAAAEQNREVMRVCEFDDVRVVPP